MDWFQNLLDNSSTPVLTAFLLGLLTAISPCPLATNIAAVGFIGRNIENRRRVFINGLLYTLCRVLSYTLLGVVLIMILKEGSSMFGIQKTIGTWGELLIGPMLLIIGLFMLWGDRLNLPKFGFNGNTEGLARKGGAGALLIGVLFALAFCPTSGVFYFGMLIPMSATATAGYLFPAVFAIATAIPVLIVAWILAFSVQQMSSFYGRIKTVQKWLNLIVGILFIVIGIYYCFVMFFLSINL
ncbi:aromatic aminobenezylarsenical efflux permease ArsG family transporter [Bacteroides caecigallinarum]|uniref:aromatic aminobenezylarsenical efflux permease ArsG family transporter n=1 Tax=Bacteroides caecigallinarum TaxID=1411144 RepID=UPI001F2FC6ED|nr:aromatic aminobenezylarsenical efflux permease ArsG family transporter [Bacteroides caecigallinarum]MCF2738440.1 sulfite exporter TauE/SafE family protein [Bacteroides caecigallinarum]